MIRRHVYLSWIRRVSLERLFIGSNIPSSCSGASGMASHLPDNLYSRKVTLNTKPVYVLVCVDYVYNKKHCRGSIVLVSCPPYHGKYVPFDNN